MVESEMIIKTVLLLMEWAVVTGIAVAAAYPLVIYRYHKKTHVGMFAEVGEAYYYVLKSKAATQLPDLIGTLAMLFALTAFSEVIAVALAAYFLQAMFFINRYMYG